MKYIILALGIWGLIIAWFISSSWVEHGWPTHPVYYVSAAAAILINLQVFLWKKTIKRRYHLILLVFFLAIFSLSLSGNELAQQIGRGFIHWALISALILAWYIYIKKRLSNAKQTEADENLEYSARGLVIMLLSLVIIFIPLFIIVFIAFLLS